MRAGVPISTENAIDLERILAMYTSQKLMELKQKTENDYREVLSKLSTCCPLSTIQYKKELQEDAEALKSALRIYTSQIPITLQKEQREQEAREKAASEARKQEAAEKKKEEDRLAAIAAEEAKIKRAEEQRLKGIEAEKIRKELERELAEEAALAASTAATKKAAKAAKAEAAKAEAAKAEAAKAEAEKAEAEKAEAAKAKAAKAKVEAERAKAKPQVATNASAGGGAGFFSASAGGGAGSFSASAGGGAGSARLVQSARELQEEDERQLALILQLSAREAEAKARSAAINPLQGLANALAQQPAAQIPQAVVCPNCNPNNPEEECNCFKGGKTYYSFPFKMGNKKR